MAEAANGAGRIHGVQDGKGGLFARMAFQYSRREYGAVMEPTRVYAHHPMLMLGYGALETATARADRLPEDLKALAATKAAALAHCEFCMDIASMISTKAGVAEAKLRALPDHATSPEFSDVERLVLDFAVGMTRTPVEVSDELFARLREHFDEAQLVELANEIAIENYRARFNWAFDIGAQGFTEGAFCVRPEAVPAVESVRPHARRKWRPRPPVPTASAWSPRARASPRRTSRTSSTAPAWSPSRPTSSAAPRSATCRPSGPKR